MQIMHNMEGPNSFYRALFANLYCTLQNAIHLIILQREFHYMLKTHFTFYSSWRKEQKPAEQREREREKRTEKKRG